MTIRAENTTELAHTAMCVWEHVNPESLAGGTSDLCSEIGDYVNACVMQMGITELRFSMVNLARAIEQLYSSVESVYDEPFDNSFVPAAINAIFWLYGHLGVRNCERLMPSQLLATWLLMSDESLCPMTLAEQAENLSVRKATDYIGEFEVAVLNGDGSYRGVANFGSQEIALKAVEAAGAVARAKQRLDEKIMFAGVAS